MKCVSYTRTLPWKNHQGELAIAEQNQRIAVYLAEHKELDLLKKYSDRKNDEKARTAFDQMTDDGVERKFDCIIVASMYYCGPDFPAARQAIKETLYATGIDLIVLDEGLDTRTASRKEVEDYFEAKRCEMHAEIMFAWRRKQGAGFRLTSSVPFGYIRRNGESNMIKDEEVAPYLSEAFSRYASGQKMRDIAKWLNEQGVEPPMRHKKRILGKSYDAESDQWTTDMLRCLFRNPTYTGAAANGSRQIIAENCHEPYITKEQFYAFPCNMREGENKISIRKSYKKPNPLAKHIVCTCGYALCWHKDKKTEEELFYCRHCRAHKENGKNLKVPAATIYKKVMDALELEHLEEEKLAAAIQQGAGRKAIEVVRAERSVQMKSVLAELNRVQFQQMIEDLNSSFHAFTWTTDYVKDAGLSQSNYWKYENQTSGGLKSELPGVWKSNGSKTDINNTDSSETDLIYSAPYVENTAKEMREDERYRLYFQDKLEIPILEKNFPHDREILMEILELLVETVTSRKKFLRICGEEKPKEVVKSRLMKLDSMHIQYVMECLKSNTTQVRNIKQYLLATLYNAPTTIDSYYAAQVRHDFGWGGRSN